MPIARELARSRQLAPPNAVMAFRDAFEAYSPGTKWGETRAAGDIIQVDGNAAAASYLTISKDPLTVGQSQIETLDTFDVPFDMAVGLSISQRFMGQEFAVELVSNETPITAPADLAISSIQQATTTLTVSTTLPHNLKPGYRIGVRDCADSRMNYPGLVVATTPTANQFTVTAGANGAMPSVTAGPFASGFVYLRPALGFAPNGTSMIFENAAATNGSFYVRSEAGDVLPSGAITGNHAVTIGTTASIQAINAALAYSFQPTNEQRLTVLPDSVHWSNVAVDAVTASTHLSRRTQVVPNPAVPYKLRFRAWNSPSLTRPVAQIVSVAKTGTNTATVTTDVPHGLTTADWIVSYGVRDQTNFANLAVATAVASIVSPTVFTVVWGSAVTATSYGGFVARVNGGFLLPGAITMAGSTFNRTSNIVTLVVSASFTGALIGDYVNLVGVRDNSTGASLGVDGAYRIRDIQTTTVYLEPIGSTPTGADIATTNCGGGIIKRTDLRLSYVRMIDYERQRVEMRPLPNTDSSQAASVVLASGTLTTVSSVSVVTAVTSANLALPGIIADVASAAIASTATTAAVTPTFGTSYEVCIPVTAVSGTSPTMDVVIQESDDTGTNWFDVYHFPRITATGIYRSPKLPMTGNRVRYVQTIGGTTPSFTRAINRLQSSDDTLAIRQLIDRAISLTTLNAATAALDIKNCRSAQLVINLGAATTPPTLQLEGSDDNGATWYAIGSALAGVASSTVQVTVNNIQAAFLRARVSIVGATVTAGYVLIKGF
ncbi:MAG: hypothetical protein ACOYLQ_09510 [Hyphomicrobiaceae bacterium]